MYVFKHVIFTSRGSQDFLRVAIFLETILRVASKKSLRTPALTDYTKYPINDGVVVVVQVDGIVLSGFTNQQAVEILKQTGQVVKLRITRYLRGLKFQELQEGIAQANAETPNTNSPYLITPNESKMTGFENQVRKNYLYF